MLCIQYIYICIYIYDCFVLYHMFSMVVYIYITNNVKYYLYIYIHAHVFALYSNMNFKYIIISIFMCPCELLKVTGLPIWRYPKRWLSHRLQTGWTENPVHVQPKFVQHQRVLVRLKNDNMAHMINQGILEYPTFKQTHPKASFPHCSVYQRSKLVADGVECKNPEIGPGTQPATDLWS